MKAVIHNANIRGCERKTNKAGGEYLLVRFEDETGRQHELVDKGMDRQPYYVRNADLDLYIDIDQGPKWTTIRIIEAKAVKAAQ